MQLACTYKVNIKNNKLKQMILVPIGNTYYSSIYNKGIIVQAWQESYVS